MNNLSLINNIILIIAAIGLLVASIIIFGYFIHVERVYNGLSLKKIIMSLRLNKKTENNAPDIIAVNSILMATIPFAIIVMTNDGPDPCELKRSISLNSSYDEQCNNSHINLF